MGPALQYLSAIIEHNQEFSELNCVQHITSEHRRQLKDSYLIEAFNLKIAIEFQMKNTDAAKAALESMPHREDSDLDPVRSADNCVHLEICNRSLSTIPPF